MAEPGASEMWIWRRTADPPNSVDLAPAPVAYTRYANHGPATPSPYDIPPPPSYVELPRHFLPPYDYMHKERAPPPVPLESRQIHPTSLEGPVAAPEVRPHRGVPPPRDVHDGVAPMPPPPRHTAIPPYEPPVDMVIPGVQHPDGRFEPHPYFARRSAPEPALPVEPEVPSKNIVEVAVPVCCEACRERVTNYVAATPGVDEVDCDVDAQKVTVIGDLPPADVLQRCKKCFRKSTLL